MLFYGVNVLCGSYCLPKVCDVPWWEVSSLDVFIVFTAHVSTFSPSNPRSCRLISFRFDSEIGSNDDDDDADDDVVISATSRRHMKPASHTSPRSSETTLTHTEEPQNASEGSCKRTNTSENPGVFSTTTCAPCSDITSSKQCSETQQQSRRKAQVKARDKPDILRVMFPKFPKGIRPEIDINADAGDEERQDAENLTAHSIQS